VFARSGGDGPSEIESAVAGLLQHMPGLSLVYNPTINSYKRLVPGYFAPVNASWGFDNRTAAVRVLTPSPERTRIEIRRPGADANPYLVLAAAVGSALAGIRAGAHPPEPILGDAGNLSVEQVPSLPTSLEGALAAFRSDTAITKMMGEAFCAYYATTREWELEAWRHAVTDWEHARYGNLG
jgi:glutamine synthetase